MMSWQPRTTDRNEAIFGPRWRSERVVRMWKLRGRPRSMAASQNSS